jgi:SAM-dependent methyltransferase
MDCKSHFFPEVAAGGYTRVDGTVDFYSRVNSLLNPEFIVLDSGAGRGVGPSEDPVGYRRALQMLRGKCKKVIGVDIDDAVRGNPALDQAHVISADTRMPLGDETVDLIVSDHTFEHVENAAFVAGELHRVLRPGGWICARTPNRWGYIALGARIIPNKLHSIVLRRLQPHRKEIDVFPTVYNLNTRRSLEKHFPSERYEKVIYGHFAEPAYFGSSRILWWLMLKGFQIVPESLAPTWMIFMRKK